MDPLGPVLQIRQALLDETSPSDLRAPGTPALARDVAALEIGQLIDARIVALSDGGAVAQIGNAVVNLQVQGLLVPGQQVRLQVLSNQAPLQFRLLAEAQSNPAAAEIELSGTLPLLIASDGVLDGSGRHAPANWPTELSANAASMLPHQDLVDLFETAVRQLLQGDTRVSSSPPADFANPQATLPGATLNQDPASAASLIPVHPQQLSAAPDPRFLAYVGWAWPEQALEVEVDQRAKNPALDEYMRRCVVSLRLTLPHCGRIETVLASTTAGLNIDIEAADSATAEQLREDSGHFIDVLRSLEIRVGAMVVRHV